MNIRVHLIVSGRVQGVCYRMYARDEALRLGLTGWIRNRPDGSVEAVAEGDEQNIVAFVRWCGEGPPAARVTGILPEYSEPKGNLGRFQIACSRTDSQL